MLNRGSLKRSLDKADTEQASSDIAGEHDAERCRVTHGDQGNGMIQASSARQIRDPSEDWLACLGWVQSGDVQTAEVCCLHLAAATRGLRCWCGSAPYAIVKVLD